MSSDGFNEPKINNYTMSKITDSNKQLVTRATAHAAHDCKEGPMDCTLVYGQAAGRLKFSSIILSLLTHLDDM